MTDSATFAAACEIHCKTQAKANEHNKRVVFDALSAVCITAVNVTFDGEGDSGQIEDIVAHADGEVVPLPTTTLTIQSPQWNSDETTSSDMALPEAIEDLCYGYLTLDHGGWGNNDGAYGEFRFDVASRTIELEFNGRYSDVWTSAYTF